LNQTAAADDGIDEAGANRGGKDESQSDEAAV
jgi:hypothetical protein